MPRRPKPWYRRDRRMFHTTIEGKQYPLGVTNPKDEAGAWEALKSLITRLENKGLANTPTLPARTVKEAVEAFLKAKAHKVRAITLRNYARHLAHFSDDFGECQIAALDGQSVPVRARLKKWSDTNLNNYLATVEACLKSVGLPISFDKPGKESAGAESVIPETVYKACLRESSGDFQQFIRFLWATGCRPSEASNLRHEMIDHEAGVARLKQHKTKGRTGRPRLIFLGPEALAIIKEQKARHSVGHLFQGMRGKPFSVQALVMRFIRLSAKVGHNVTAYQFRHTFATRALASGVPDAHVSALLGHVGTTMVHKHYSHIAHDAKLLRGVAERLGG